MSAKPVKITKVQGSLPQPGVSFGAHPERVASNEVDRRAMTPMSEASLKDVFTPFYDRPDFTQDNAARRANNKSWVIPAGQGITRRVKDNG